MIASVRSANQRSNPLSSVIDAITAVTTAGSAAMIENSMTMRTCRRAAARPRLRANQSPDAS
jgi:hypothetical protein